ncbi:uncharacterized protein LOC120005342 isoform X2 [Tripterygium wilfordii]|uniref:uncharacterized protein LOC120005342 isoform X2 n=1 Tax=Tripterygium wilfordii TaxID=458696 RepID=UPI0018F823EC|nr:uncharacterized protein LOC120005342 isoform X2 [Tripterygium wilfordii]
MEALFLFIYFFYATSMDALDIADLSTAVEGGNLSNLLEDNTAGRTESWILNQTSQDELHQVVLTQPNQVGSSRRVNIAQGIAQDRVEKKRWNDKRYRDRCKERKKKMQDELDKFTVENRHVKLANQSIRTEINSMNLKLESKTKEIKQLQDAMNKLRRQNGCIEVLMEAFLQRMVSSKDRDDQLEMLTHEITILRQNVAFIGWMEEKTQLVNRFADLEHQNKHLKVKIQALCEKISNDRR